jgi:hypothetical protein
MHTGKTIHLGMDTVALSIYDFQQQEFSTTIYLQNKSRHFHPLEEFERNFHPL